MSQLLLSAVSVALSIFCSLAIVSFTFGKKVNQLDTLSEDVKELKKAVADILDKIDRMNESMNSRINAMTESMNSRINAMNDRFSQTKEGLVRLETVVLACVPGAKDAYSVHNSPLDFSPKGEELAQELNAAELVNAHIEELKAKLNPEKLTNPYDIQQETFRVVMYYFYSMLTPEEMSKVKNAAFRRGELIEQFLTVFKLQLRNEILKQHGINIKDWYENKPEEKKPA